LHKKFSNLFLKYVIYTNLTKLRVQLRRK